MQCQSVKECISESELPKSRQMLRLREKTPRYGQSAVLPVSR